MSCYYYLWKALKMYWWSMLEPPWRDSGSDDERSNHWVIWLIGWTWAVAGVVLGALLGPSIVQWAGFSHTQYQDWVVIAVAALAGFFIQLLGWCALFVFIRNITALFGWKEPEQVPDLAVLLISLVSFAFPLAGVGYALYRYFTWVGAGQRSVTVAFVGGLLVKTFVIPFIKGLVTGALFKWFMNWLHGGKPKSA